MVMNSIVARERIESTPDIPTLPSVASEILMVANNPMTSANDVSDIIHKDQALTSKVLKLVNSAFYGFPGKIKTIQHSVVIIGFNKVKNIVMAASLFDMTKGKEKKLLNIPNFWIYSLTTAIAAQETIKFIDPKISPDDLFVAGLIHSIGTLILDQVFPKEYTMVLEKRNSTNSDISVIEKEELGFTHMQAGEWATEKWQLPLMLRSCIRYYRTPTRTKYDHEAVAAVHVGSVISRSLGINFESFDLAIPFDKKIISKYHLSVDKLDKIIGKVIEELKLAQDFIDLIHSK